MDLFTPKALETLEIESPQNPSVFQKLHEQVKARTRGLVLAFGIGAAAVPTLAPQKVDAQDIGLDITAAVFTVPVASEGETISDETITKMKEAVSKFNEELKALSPEERQIAGVDFSDILSNFDLHQKQRVIGLYMANMTVIEAVNQVYFSSLEKTPNNIKKAYSQLINLGRQEYITYMLQTERFVSGRFADKDNEWKIQKAGEFFDDDLNAYLEGNNTGRETTQRLAEFSPTITEAFLRLGIGTSQMREVLIMSQGIAQNKKDIDILREEQDKQNAIQAELRALLETLKVNS